MKKLSITGRILFAVPFGIFGLNHFLMLDFFTGLLTSFVPGAGFSVLLTGILLMAASISILLKRYIRLACYLLAGLLLIFILAIHVPGLFDPSTAQISLMQLLKDTSLMGGALLIASSGNREEGADNSKESQE